MMSVNENKNKSTGDEIPDIEEFHFSDESGSRIVKWHGLDEDIKKFGFSAM